MFKYILIFLSNFFIYSTFAQDTTYYNVDDVKVISLKKAFYYSIVTKNKMDTSYTHITYFKSGKLRSENYYRKNASKNIAPYGINTEYYQNGQLREKTEYKNGSVANRFTYWVNGTPKRIEIFEKDSLISGKCFNTFGTEVAYHPYYTNAVLEDLKDSIIVKDLMNKISDYKSRIITMVNLLIDKNGNVSIKVLEGDKEFARNAKKQIKQMPRYIPAMLEGEPVSSILIGQVKYMSSINDIEQRRKFF